MEKMTMNEPEKRGFLFENLILAWNRLTLIKRIAEKLQQKKVYNQLPETVKDDIQAIKETAVEIREDVESTTE